MPGKHRLDQILVHRGIFDSREKAQRAIMAGQVRVGEQIVDKASSKFDENAQISVATPDRYVGRGGQSWKARCDISPSIPQG
jgi:23S rRNA (cytidine1920-2'-O)/16S rRNA (cytidine1409-2'-O)-methyltransferase